MRPLLRTTSICLVALALVAALASVAPAADLYVLGGAIKSLGPSDNTYSWQLEYRQDLLQHLAMGVSYLNEGHITRHHRDGYTTQLWGRTELADYRLTLAAGVGPYLFLDTENKPTLAGYSNLHGVKGMLSLAAAWHTTKDFTFELRSNFVTFGPSFDTASVLAGVGYHFDPDLKPVSVKAVQEPKNEITLLAGQTIVNSYNSQHASSTAAEIEYRRMLLRHLDVTLSYLYEGDNRLVRRDGIIAQLWATQPLVEGMFAVAAGIGPYFDVGDYHGLTGSKTVSGMLTLTGSYRFAPHWAARLSWNRLITTYDRDTDVIVGGIGYRF
jgi:hypothetical protein